MLLNTLVFIGLVNTNVTVLALEANCTVQTFSCPCDQSNGVGATDFEKVSFTSCATDGNHSKDVCSSDDVRAKCHETLGLLQHHAYFFAKL